ncbi:sensor domain-containing diguanylate cyclase [Azospirillum sp. TSO35-2]|uniref:sensor domain-containing diguanylate cyclase n=1 Tax=Azospirillum sp. TSO35-2 TaxID=716796 RepID=UPI001304C9A8|nr:sensor domain-containing diguanylate cyclase [Azospirillum sp. TSO35-2]
MGAMAQATMLPGRVWSLADLAALNLIADAAWIVDSRSVGVWWANDAARALTGAGTADEQSFRLLAGLPDPASLDALLRRLADGERVTERWTVAGGGGPVALSCLCSGIRIDDGRMAMLVVAREADAAAVECLRGMELLQHAMVGMALYSWPDGHALMRNPAARDCCADPDVGFQDRFVDADDAAAVMTALATTDAYHGLARIRTNQGERWHGMDAQRTRDPVTGQPAIAVNERDVTDYVLAKEALHQSEQRLARMVEHLPVGAAYVEGERIFLNQSAERITGYHRTELPTLDAWFKAAYADHHDEMRRRYDVARQAGAPVLSELQIRCKSGALRWIRFSAYLTPGGEVWLLEDVTEHRATLEALHQERAVLQSLIESMPDIVFFKDRDGVYLNYNRAASDYVGRVPKPDERVRDIDLVDAETAARRRQVDALAIEQGVVRNEEWFVYRDGRQRLMETVKTACRDRDGQVLGVVGISRDITDRRAMEEMLRRSEAEKDHMANHDPLTGLPNRRLFFSRASAALARSRQTGQQVALLFIDLDGFKPVNDRLGHDSGDQVLRVTAERLTHSLRASDTVARVGGDEFVVLLEGVTALADVDRLAAKLVEALSVDIPLDSETVSVGTSIGVALYPHDASDPGSLLKAADNALYQAKRLGRGQHVFCQPQE